MLSSLLLREVQGNKTLKYSSPLRLVKVRKSESVPGTRERMQKEGTPTSGRNVNPAAGLGTPGVDSSVGVCPSTLAHPSRDGSTGELYPASNTLQLQKVGNCPTGRVWINYHVFRHCNTTRPGKEPASSSHAADK